MATRIFNLTEEELNSVSLEGFGEATIINPENEAKARAAAIKIFDELLAHYVVPDVVSLSFPLTPPPTHYGAHEGSQHRRTANGLTVLPLRTEFLEGHDWNPGGTPQRFEGRVECCLPVLLTKKSPLGDTPSLSLSRSLSPC